MIDCIDAVIEDHIDKEIRDCQFFSIQCDETLDLSTKEQLSVIVRLDNKGQIVTVHGKTYVNDLSLKRKNQRTTNEQRTNVPNVSTNYPNVPSIWSEKYERVKAKIHTIF